MRLGGVLCHIKKDFNRAISALASSFVALQFATPLFVAVFDFERRLRAATSKKEKAIFRNHEACRRWWDEFSSRVSCSLLCPLPRFTIELRIFRVHICLFTHFADLVKNVSTSFIEKLYVLRTCSHWRNDFSLLNQNWSSKKFDVPKLEFEFDVNCIRMWRSNLNFEWCKVTFDLFFWTRVAGFARDAEFEFQVEIPK